MCLLKEDILLQNISMVNKQTSMVFENLLLPAGQATRSMAQTSLKGFFKPVAVVETKTKRQISIDLFMMFMIWSMFQQTESKNLSPLRLCEVTKLVWLV